MTGSRQISYLQIKINLSTFFFKRKLGKDDLLLNLTTLNVADNYIEWKAAIKVLEKLLNENIALKEHIRTAEIKLAKTIGLLYRAKLSFKKNLLKESILYIFIHIYTMPIMNWLVLTDPSLKQSTFIKVMLSVLSLMEIINTLASTFAITQYIKSLPNKLKPSTKFYVWNQQITNYWIN